MGNNAVKIGEGHGMETNGCSAAPAGERPHGISLQSLREEYSADVSEMEIQGRRFRMIVPSSLDRFIDTQDVFRDFPLWSKIWEASWVLADHLARIPVSPGKRLLELGAGIGLVGIVGASFGHDVTMTEHNPHSIDFARANARLNGCPDLKILQLDWNNPAIDGKFDCIVGSEITYQEESFNSILNLVNLFLKPGGEIILSSEMRKTTFEFLNLMKVHFDIRAQKKTLRSDDRVIGVILCKMTFKQ